MTTEGLDLDETVPELQSSTRMSPIALGVCLTVLMALWAGLAILFYTPEKGFGWFAEFLIVTVVVLVPFIAYVVWDAKKRTKALLAKTDDKQQAEQPLS